MNDALGMKKAGYKKEPYADTGFKDQSTGRN